MTARRPVCAVEGAAPSRPAAPLVRRPTARRRPAAVRAAIWTFDGACVGAGGLVLALRRRPRAAQRSFHVLSQTLGRG